MILKIRNNDAGRIDLQWGQTRVDAVLDCPRDDSGLFRGYLLFPRGEIMLGVLEPCGKQMMLRRTLLRKEIEKLGTPIAGEVRMSFPFRQAPDWQQVKRPEEVFRSKEMVGRLRRWEGGLWKKERGKTLLALPYHSGKPFPMTGLFCFARIQSIGQKQYAVFTFDGDELPVVE